MWNALIPSVNPLTYTILSAKLKQLGQYTFTLSLVNQTSYTSGALPYTSEFRIAGKWLKLFGLDPAKNSVETTDKYISCTIAAATPSLTLQVHGYDNINIHSAIAKSLYVGAQSAEDGNIRIHSQTYSSFQMTILANQSTFEYIIPINVSSLKAIYFTFSPTSWSNVESFDQTD